MAGSPLLFDFNFVTLRIKAKTSGSYEAKNDLYSDWKELVIENQDDPVISGAPPAFDTTGGDPLTVTQEISPYYFLRNDFGWRLEPPEEDGETTINGNVFPRDPLTPFIIPTVGAFTQLMRLIVSPQSITETLSTITDDLKLIKALTAGDAEVSVDDLTVTIYDPDIITSPRTVLAIYSISTDERIRIRTF